MKLSQVLMDLNRQPSDIHFIDIRGRIENCFLFLPILSHQIIKI